MRRALRDAISNLPNDQRLAKAIVAGLIVYVLGRELLHFVASFAHGYNPELLESPTLVVAAYLAVHLIPIGVAVVEYRLSRVRNDPDATSPEDPDFTV